MKNMTKKEHADLMDKCKKAEQDGNLEYVMPTGNTESWREEPTYTSGELKPEYRNWSTDYLKGD